jgi:hypothetical protein
MAIAFSSFSITFHEILHKRKTSTIAQTCKLKLRCKIKHPSEYRKLGRREKIMLKEDLGRPYHASLKKKKKNGTKRYAKARVHKKHIKKYMQKHECIKSKCIRSIQRNICQKAQIA